MQWWNKWARKPGGWVERKRQFQRLFAETIVGASGQKARVVAGTETSDNRVNRNRDEK